MAEWIGLYILDLLFWIWVLNYGGASFTLVRILCMPIVYLFKFGSKDSGEIIRGIALLIIIGHSLVFFVGLGSEDFREQVRIFLF